MRNRSVVPIDYEQVARYLVENYVTTEWDNVDVDRDVENPYPDDHYFKRFRRLLLNHLNSTMCETIQRDCDEGLTAALFHHQAPGSIIDWITVGSVPAAVIKVGDKHFKLPLIIIEQLT